MKNITGFKIVYQSFVLRDLVKFEVSANKPETSPELKFYIQSNITGHYNLSVKIIALISHTTYVVWVNFIQVFKVVSERQSFREIA